MAGITTPAAGSTGTPFPGDRYRRTTVAAAWPGVPPVPLALLLSAGMAAVLALLILSPSVHMPQIVPGADKLAHVAAFAALVLPAALATPRMLRWQVPLLLAFGSGLELAQSLSGRSSSWGDAAANALGLALGVAVGLLLSWTNRRPRGLRLTA